MTIADATPPPLREEDLRARLVSRMALDLLLDLIAFARGDGHVLDTLLASAIIQANVQEIGRRADLQVTFAETNEIPPDEMRRPVSMNALAASLQLPFETVRRRVKAMAADGFCRFVEGGVMVPSQALMDPKFFAGALGGYQRLQTFYFELSDLGLLRELPRPSVDLAGDAFPMRSVARLGGTYILRVVERFGAVGDLVDGLVWTSMLRANQAPLPRDPAAEAALGAEIADGRLAPATVTAVAKRVGLPLETVRRRVAEMAARGLCRRVRGGYIVPAEARAQPKLAAITAVNVSNLMRMLGALSQLGVLALWDDLRPATATAAIPAAARGG